MKLKEGVDPKGVHYKVWEALWVMEVIYQKWGAELVVTSLRDGKHSKKRSRHYSGLAADTRTRYFDSVTQKEVTKEINEALGEDYVVILESDHIHMHFAPIYHEIESIH